MKSICVTGAFLAASLPYALAATAWAGDAPVGVLAWVIVGVVYGVGVAEVFMRCSDRHLRRRKAGVASGRITGGG